jgi:hypothetical protein
MSLKNHNEKNYIIELHRASKNLNPVHQNDDLMKTKSLEFMLLTIRILLKYLQKELINKLDI